MCAFEDRVIEYCMKSCEGKTYIEKLNSMDETLRKWVALDLHDITKASIWSILYSWGKGRSEPLAMQKEAIAEYFGTPSDELFPKDMKC